MKISIFLPVYNEQDNISEALHNLLPYRQSGHEVIVVDGGSTDNTLMLAHDAADIVIVSKQGRAIQMNDGADVASGDVLLFLHIDTSLPVDALSLITAHQGNKYLWGRFDVQLSSNKKIYRVIESLINLRSKLSSIATGDQAIFVERKLFQGVAGFPEIALMEDVELSRQLKKISAPVCIKQKVITSSRRWEINGVVNTVLLMWKLRLYYFFGVSPERLSKLYR